MIGVSFDDNSVGKKWRTDDLEWDCQIATTMNTGNPLVVVTKAQIDD